MLFFSRIGLVVLTMWFALFAGSANAVPTLQLGIVGGTYDSTTQTIIATSSVFSLYAYIKPDSTNTLSDTYYLSMALTPKVSASANLGSFTYNGNTVNATADMTYGTPPIDAFSQAFDPGDLSRHGVFPTYFKEVGFSFDSSNTSGIINTTDNPASGPIAGSGMYYKRFDFNTTNLAAGYGVHFDLYNTKLSGTDTDITQFAPFSHDAQSMIVSPVPEAQTYAMMMVGLGLIGFSVRRKKHEA